jgi:hypothetical protein
VPLDIDRSVAVEPVRILVAHLIGFGFLEFLPQFFAILVIGRD